MVNKYKKEIEEHNRRIYNSKSLPELKIIGKKKELLNVDQYKKADKNILIDRLIKGKQLSDYPKDVLLEKAQNEGLKTNASMSKNVILQKVTNPKLTDLNERRLRKLAENKGIRLRDQMTNREIIERLKNPTRHYTKQDLKRLARDNNINVRGNISKPDLINILAERNLITTTPITEEESNLGVAASKVPIKLIQVAKKKARSAREDLINYKNYIKNIRSPYITSSRLKKLFKTLERKENKAREEKERTFTSIINIFNSNRNIKTALYLHCLMIRKDPGDLTIIKEFAFHSKGLKLVLEGTDVSDLYNEMVDEIEEEIQKIEDAEGSGWQFLSVKKLVLHTTRWDPINAGSYIDLPPFLKNKKAIINMKNQDEKCFMWCVLRALNPKDTNPDRIDKDLKSKQDTLNMQGIRYPVTFRDIDRFEHLNPEISISVLGYNKDERVYPLKVSKYTGCEHDITLILIKDGENSHYCLVKNMSALLASQINNHKGTCHICLNCFNGFNAPDTLNKHKEYCYNYECVKILMPPPGTFLRFKNFLHSEKAPFAIYADFECFIKSIDGCNPNPYKSYTKKYQKHEPSGFSYYIKSFNESVFKSIKRTYKNERRRRGRRRRIY